MKPSTINQLSLSENASKLTYGNVEFQNFPGEEPRTPRLKGMEREGEKSGRKKRGGEGRGGEKRDGEVGRGGEGLGWGNRKGRGGSEGLKEREGKRREGERNLDPLPDIPDRSTPLSLIQSFSSYSRF
jgi:hypothetical protein